MGPCIFSVWQEQGQGEARPQELYGRFSCDQDGSCVSVRNRAAQNAYRLIARIAKCLDVALHFDLRFSDGSTGRLEIPT